MYTSHGFSFQECFRSNIWVGWDQGLGESGKVEKIAWGEQVELKKKRDQNTGRMDSWDVKERFEVQGKEKLPSVG